MGRVHWTFLWMEQDGEKGGNRRRILPQQVANAYLIKAPPAENPNTQKATITTLVLSIIP